MESTEGGRLCSYRPSSARATEQEESAVLSRSQRRRQPRKRQSTRWQRGWLAGLSLFSPAGVRPRTLSRERTTCRYWQTRDAARILNIGIPVNHITLQLTGIPDKVVSGWGKGRRIGWRATARCGRGHAWWHCARGFGREGAPYPGRPLILPREPPVWPQGATKGLSGSGGGPPEHPGAHGRPLVGRSRAGLSSHLKHAFRSSASPVPGTPKLSKPVNR